MRRRRRGLKERRVIERAKALMMAERKATEPQAYRINDQDADGLLK